MTPTCGVEFSPNGMALGESRANHREFYERRCRPGSSGGLEDRSSPTASIPPHVTETEITADRFGLGGHRFNRHETLDRLVYPNQVPRATQEFAEAHSCSPAADRALPFGPEEVQTCVTESKSCGRRLDRWVEQAIVCEPTRSRRKLVRPNHNIGGQLE